MAETKTEVTPRKRRKRVPLRHPDGTVQRCELCDRILYKGHQWTLEQLLKKKEQAERLAAEIAKMESRIQAKQRVMSEVQATLKP